MTKKSHQVDLEELLGEAHGPGPLAQVPPPPEAWYDFNKSTAAHAAEAAVFTEGPSMTRQEFAAECDINVLMKRYENQDIGALMRASQEPVYVDWTEMPSDLMDAMHRMGEAEKAFMTLPASVRREFDNDAIAFVDFASQQSNLDKMREWGLAPPLPIPAPVSPAEPTPPPAKPAAGPAQSSS